MIQFSDDEIFRRYAQWLAQKIAPPSIENELHLIGAFGCNALEYSEDRIIEQRVLRVASDRKWRLPTAYKLRTALKKFYYWAYEWEKVRSGRTPYQKFFATKGPTPEPKYLIDEDIQKLIGNPFASVRDSLLMRLTYYSGARRSEICALNVGDFDRDKATLHIRHGKGDRWRYVTIDRGTAELLRGYIDGLRSHGHASPGDPLFVVFGFKRISGHHLWRTIKMNAKRIGKQCTPHALRHSIGRQILANGGTVAHVQHHLGHRSASQSLQYIHLLDKDVTPYLKQTP
jgi:site-specific recombinase XerD